MKRKLSCILVFCLLFGTVAILPAAAYVRISYGADCLAPSAELIKTALRGDSYSFCEADFKQALGVSRVQNVTVLSLPPAADGVLSLNGNPVANGQMISREEIKGLTFTPASPAFSGTSFSFCANSTAGTTSLTCTLKVSERVNYAPTTEMAKETDLQVMTRRDIGIHGQMRAEDPEGDPLTYLIVAYPQKGVLNVTDTSTGHYRYTPMAGKTGKDSFTYVARDSYGNYSRPTTVSITVNERNSSLVYADMEKNPAYHAALTMAEKNIMLGSLEGDCMYFHPSETVTRGEFLVMAMKSAGISPAAGVSRTWFDDDDKIASTIKGYVATAQIYGYVSGTFDGTGLYFRPNDPITRAEAAVILNNILDAATPAVLPAFADSSDIPVWAREAIYALHAVGIFDTAENGSMAPSEAMSRADTATSLYAMMQYKGA